jgi:hypothetical protein
MNTSPLCTRTSVTSLGEYRKTKLVFSVISITLFLSLLRVNYSVIISSWQSWRHYRAKFPLSIWTNMKVHALSSLSWSN